jgi:hypothetical protein
MSFNNVMFYQDDILMDVAFYDQISGINYASLSASLSLNLANNLNAYLISDYTVSQQFYYMNETTGSFLLNINSLASGFTFSSISISIPSNYQSSSNVYTLNITTNLTTINFTIASLLNPI